MFNLYKGSDLLLPLAGYTRMPIDQVNFVATQLVALVFGYFFRIFLSPSATNRRIRHAVQISIGFLLLFFSFGLQALYPPIITIASYLILISFQPGLSDKLVFFVSMLFLGLCHCYRMYTDYAGYTLDFTGPLMITTQKVTSLAFSYSDGVLESGHSKERAIKNVPTLLEFLSYTLSFHGVICGPFCFYNDYIAFIEGKNLVSGMPDPKPFWPMTKKLMLATIFIILELTVTPLFNPNYLANPMFIQENSLLYFLYILAMTSLVSKYRYYFAWKLADATNFSAGFGFNGYDDNEHQRWDIVDSVDIVKVELATSLKNVFDGWNKMTSLWLRQIVYERTNNNSALVFLVSAYWHGFYPGYYVSFVGGAFFLILSRMMRRKIRVYFQVNAFLSKFYDFITWVVTKFLIAYFSLPFLLLKFENTKDFYLNMCFIPHLVGILLFILIKVYDHCMLTKLSKEN